MPSRLLRYMLLVAALIAVALPSFYCNNPEKEAAGGENSSAWKSVYDTSIRYVGMQECRTCHENIYQTFIQTGMGQSYDFASKQ